MNSEKIEELWKKSKLNSEIVWKIQKKRAYIHHHHHHALTGIYAAAAAAIHVYPRAATATAAAAAIHTYPRAAAAAAIALKFHPKHVTNKNKTKHIMKISHTNVNIYDNSATIQQNSD